MNIKYLVFSKTESGNEVLECGFPTEYDAETYIDTLTRYYGPISSQDLDDKVLGFVVKKVYCLPTN